MESVLHQLKKIIPESLFNQAQPAYHYILALAGAIIYRFPANHIKVVFVTGTKGKSSTVEITNAILEAAGKKTAVLGTIRIKVGDNSRPNPYKMTVPGRFFVQKFLRQAVNAGCEYAVMEMTSGAVVQFRHRFINFDALLFLNLSPEHIEQHGGYDNYVAAKVAIAEALEKSTKQDKILVVNADDKESRKFINAAPSVKAKMFSLKDAEPYMLDSYGLYLTYDGVNMRSHQQGIFNIYNTLAALTYASTQNISTEEMRSGLEKLTGIPGRVQKVTLPKDNPLSKLQDFNVVVDYAHTVDSLKKVYSVFDDTRKICVLGNTGGGRDTWKRPEMARVANDHCSHIILTNEDPYDEDPKKIVREMLPGITSTPYDIIMDRREAIRKAISMARTGDAVLITGKGTDPYIMLADGKKMRWSDARVAQEELEKVLYEKNQRENKH